MRLFLLRKRGLVAARPTHERRVATKACRDRKSWGLGLKLAPGDIAAVEAELWLPGSR